MVDEYVTKYFEYVGAGSGAFSFLNGSLYVNTFSLAEYDRSINSHQLPLAFTCSFTRAAQMQYRFMMELFDLSMDQDKFQREFNVHPQIGLWKEFCFMKFWNALMPGMNGMIKINPKQQYLLVVMMREFFQGVNWLRKQARSSLVNS